MNRVEKEASQGRAAAYVRMSTEHQQYSTSNQMDVIREYAKRRGLEIVKEFLSLTSQVNQIFFTRPLNLKSI